MNKMHLLGLIFITSFVSFNAQALVLMGEALAQSRDDSKKEALSALSESIYVDITSIFESVKDDTGKMHAEKIIRSRSDLPILGAKFEFEKKGNKEYYTKAILDPKQSGHLYEKRLNALHIEIARDLKTSRNNTIDPDAKHSLLVGLQTKLAQYVKLGHVAVLLGLREPKTLSTSEAQLKTSLAKLETEAETISLAAQTLSKGIIQQKVYVYPPTFQDSHEITKLARLLKEYVSKNLHAVDNHKNAVFYFKGNYIQDRKGLYVTYKLLDRYGNTLSVRTVNLLPNAYKGIEYKTKNIDFDQLIHHGYVVKSDFKVDVNTNRGKEDILVVEKDENSELTIFIKLNQPGYYYIVGHSLNDKNKISYLLEIMTSAKGKRKLLRYVNVDEVNKWISLGKFEATPPFGIENLQVIASNIDLIDKMPAYKFDAQKELYVISNNPLKTVVKTRALKPKKNKKKKIKSSEAILTFTTM